MPHEVTEVTRCSLLVPRLVRIEALPVRSTDQLTIMHVIVDLEPGISVWEADDAIGRAVIPSDLGLRTDVRIPNARRLVLAASIPRSKPLPGQVAQIVGQVADVLLACQYG